ncbi:MAG: hypothetical protein J5633_03150 [Oscillospiraceae bacterium]|nr:hypothetical protein [Oscillospiraceae bacterium]
MTATTTIDVMDTVSAVRKLTDLQICQGPGKTQSETPFAKQEKKIPDCSKQDSPGSLSFIVGGPTPPVDF